MLTLDPVAGRHDGDPVSPDVNTRVTCNKTGKREAVKPGVTSAHKQTGEGLLYAPYLSVSVFAGVTVRG